jgi:hypothetical protein
MDTRIIRRRAREEYKKMIKSLPKNKRPTFKSIYPMIKESLLKKRGSNGDLISKQASEVAESDMGTLDDMIIDVSSGSDNDGVAAQAGDVTPVETLV